MRLQRETNEADPKCHFVMKPLGRFFQVTETLDFKKYFLDIEKIERYPLSFVVKSEESIDELLAKIKADALKTSWNIKDKLAKRLP